MNKLARKQAIDQVPCTSPLDKTEDGFESVAAFLDHAEMGVVNFVRQMLRACAEEEYLRFIGSKHYERTPS